MRWSPILFFLTVLVPGLLVVLASPLPGGGDNGLVELERRARTSARLAAKGTGSASKPARSSARLAKVSGRPGRAVPVRKAKTRVPRRAGKTKAGKSTALNAGSLKQSSKTYRKTALSNPNTYSKSGKGVKVGKTPGKAPKGKDADHILEAQTVAKAMRRAGHTDKTKISKGLAAAKGVVNGRKNLNFVDSGINQEKGRATRQELNGKRPTVSLPTRDYMRKTNRVANRNARAVDKALRRAGVRGVNVQLEQRRAMKRVGI